jgi:hypothetical protein
VSNRFIVQQIVSVTVNMKTALILCFSWQSVGVCLTAKVLILIYFHISLGSVTQIT